MTQNELLKKISDSCNGKISFVPSNTYFWSPKDSTVYYQQMQTVGEVGLWTLLHEASHGLLEHKTYESDFELLLLEVRAWEHAEKLGKSFDIKIDQDHIQDCLDSYRDWQYKRSLCPRCDLGGIQTDQKTYKCMFCNDTWHVSEARFCRPYRRRAL